MIMKYGLFACVAAAALTGWAGSALAADATATDAAAATASTDTADTSGSAIGAVIVTARKTSENLQRVPVAVTSQTGAQLERQRVTMPTDLARVTPSLFVRNSSSSGNSAQFALRGQYAADSLLGISQPVGLYEDTVNIPHPFGGNNAFFDLDRVEVLKGPQGTLYGRNTTAGAVNIITRNADYRGVHGYLDGEVGSFKDMRIGGAINIPIIDDVLAVRIGYQRWSRDGFGHSTVTNQTFGDGLDSHLARISIKFDPTPNFTATAKVEYYHNRNNGQDLWNIGLAPGSTLALESEALYSDYGKYAPMLVRAFNAQNTNPADPAFNPDPAGNLASVLAQGHRLLDPCVGGDPYTNCSGLTQHDILTTWHADLDMTWRINDNLSLRSITGYHGFQNDKNGDLSAIHSQVLDIGYGLNAVGGYTPLAPQVVSPNGYGPLQPDPADQADGQWSQEFDLSGKAFENRLSWLVGFFYSTDEGHGSQPAGDLEELFPLLTLTNPAFGVPLATQLADVANPGANANPVYFSPPAFAHDAHSVSNNQWAFFTQNDFKINDIFSVTLGLRYTREHVAQDLSNWNFHFDGSSAAGGYFTCDVGNPNTHYATVPDCSEIAGGVIPVGQPGAGKTFTGAAGPNGSWLAQSYGALTYLASFNAQVTRDTLLYFKVSRGFRGAAYGRSNGPPAKPEYDQDYEFGLKSDLLDHHLRVNLALFQSDIKDKQVSALQCIGSLLSTGFCDSLGFTTVVLNAATARIRGVELEAIAAPFEGLTINFNGSYNDSVYLDFPGAASGDGVPLGELKNVPIAVSPTWQGDIGARYEHAFGPGTMGVNVDANYRGKFPITPITHQAALTPQQEQFINRAVTIVNASLDYRLPDLGVTMSLFATNLGGVVWGYQGISPNYTGGVGHMYMQAPREFGFTIKKTWGGG